MGILREVPSSRMMPEFSPIMVRSPSVHSKGIPETENTPIVINVCSIYNKLSTTRIVII